MTAKTRSTLQTQFDTDLPDNTTSLIQPVHARTAVKDLADSAVFPEDAASETAVGVVELATTAEVGTGTDTTRAVTPAGLTAKEATIAQWRDKTADKILTGDVVWDAAAYVALTDAATIALNMANFINASVTLGGNRTLGNPTNPKVGQSGCIRVTQDGTGGRTLAFASNWVASGTPADLATGAGDINLIFYHVDTTTRIFYSLNPL